MSSYHTVLAICCTTCLMGSQGAFWLPVQEAAMEQYRGVVKKHTSFTLDLLRHTMDGNTYRYSSNFRQALVLSTSVNDMRVKMPPPMQDRPKVCLWPAMLYKGALPMHRS